MSAKEILILMWDGFKSYEPDKKYSEIDMSEEECKSWLYGILNQGQHLSESYNEKDDCWDPCTRS